MQTDDPVAEPGARIKLIGGDSGRYEHEELVDQVLLAPRRWQWSTSCSSARAARRGTEEPALPRARLDGPVAGLSSV